MRIGEAPTEALQTVLADQTLPLHLRQMITAQLEARARRAAELEHATKFGSEIARYRVTKGGRFVTEMGVTELPPGSLVTEATHNFKQLAAQGIEVEPVTSVTIERDQLGNQISRVQ